MKYVSFSVGGRIHLRDKRNPRERLVKTEELLPGRRFSIPDFDTETWRDRNAPSCVLEIFPAGSVKFTQYYIQNEVGSLSWTSTDELLLDLECHEHLWIVG